MSAKTKVVTSRSEDGSKVWDFRCPYSVGCGIPGGEPFSSVGWASRDLAVDRAKQHVAEHETGEPAQELHAFREERGVTDSAGSSVRPADWEF